MRRRNVDWRWGTAVLFGGMLVGASGCIPQIDDPEVFVEEMEALRDEWDSICKDKCGGADEPYACQMPPEVGTCTRFKRVEALACYSTFKKVVNKEICGANNQTMQNLIDDCADVYDLCEVDGGTGTGTDTGTGGGTDTGTGGTTGA